MTKMGFGDRPSVFLEVDYTYFFERWGEAAQGRPLIEVIEPEARRGGRFAQCALGEILLFGRDTPKDIPRAIHWLKRAAAQRDERAQELLDSIGEDI